MKNKLLLILLQISFFCTVSPASDGPIGLQVMVHDEVINIIPLESKIPEESVLGIEESVAVLKAFLELVLALQSHPESQIVFSIPCGFYVIRHNIDYDRDRCCRYIMRHLETLSEAGGVSLALWNEYFEFARELLKPAYSLVSSHEYNITTFPMLCRKLLDVLPVDLLADKRSIAKNMIDDFNSAYDAVPQGEAAVYTKNMITSVFYIGSAGGPEAVTVAYNLLDKILRALTRSEEVWRPEIIRRRAELEALASDPE